MLNNEFVILENQLLFSILKVILLTPFLFARVASVLEFAIFILINRSNYKKRSFSQALISSFIRLFLLKFTITIKCNLRFYFEIYTIIPSSYSDNFNVHIQV